MYNWNQKKTILVFSHRHNTFDKRKLLENPHPNFVRDSDKSVNDFVKEADLREFYMNEVDHLLKDYKPGEPTMKPDVLKQMVEIEEFRRKHLEEMAKKNQQEGQIVVTDNEGKSQPINNKQVVGIIKEQQEKIKDLVKSISVNLGTEVRIRDFKILKLGDGIEVAENDFAAEVAATAGMK